MRRKALVLVAALAIPACAPKPPPAKARPAWFKEACVPILDAAAEEWEREHADPD